MNKVKNIAKIAVPLMLAALPLMTLALVQPTNPQTGNALSLSEIESIINRIATFLIVVSIIIAVGFIIWGAIVYMSAGGDDERAGKGKKYIINGIIGAAVVFAIGVILQTVSGLIARTFFS